MQFDIIDKLRNADPSSRVSIIEKMYQKNMAFFKENHIAVFNFIEEKDCPFGIELTDNFLNIVRNETGEIMHPVAGLDHFAEMMGGWVHEAWVDLFDMKIAITPKYPEHFKPVNRFDLKLKELFPEFISRYVGGQINLKELGSRRRFSPPVVFLGIFHGLHIAHYLDRTDLGGALFIEPEPERFEVSCYFLDYAEIENKFGKLCMSIGAEATSGAILSFFASTKITTQKWVRVLPGYQYDKTPYLIESIKSLISTNSNIVYPLDYDIKSLKHGVENISRKMPLLTRRVKVSKKCRIAVVATGPSLDNDIKWLKKNQNKLIIFAVHSSVMVLLKHGIKPDFQFNLDTVINYDFKNILQLPSDVPLIADYRVQPDRIAGFKKILLCGDRYKQAPVRLLAPLTNTHPSTTCMTVSFACYCQPEKIYLLGCDFGYRSRDKDHVQGSIYENSRQKNGTSGSLYEQAMQMLVEPNFPGSGSVQTAPFLQQAKIAVEKCLVENSGGVPVVNMADGALISGAVPEKSAKTRLSKYKNKSRDIHAIINAFSPAGKGINWEPYQLSGAERLQRFKRDLFEFLAMEEFSWLEFSLKIDTVLDKVITGNNPDKDDFRLDIYYRVLSDILSVWYTCLIFFDDQEKAEQVYREGVTLLKEVIDDLHWPAELDKLQLSD